MHPEDSCHKVTREMNEMLLKLLWWFSRRLKKSSVENGRVKISNKKSMLGESH